jgi:CubicO group peptidase (beta-lactamase class C family)
MSVTFGPDCEPDEIGLDPARLGRIVPFFRERYVDTGRITGFQVVVSRGGRVALCAESGTSDRSSGRPLERDCAFRIFSMTKPVTSVALMMLYEEGRFQLDQPVSRWIPGFADLRVWMDGTADAPLTRLPEREMTVRDLLTHTSGLTYGFMSRHPVDELYRRRQINASVRLAGTGLATSSDLVDELTTVPLLFSPGSRWSYSVATDVVGRLVEIISGLSLDRFFQERILGPLGMHDTGFVIGPDVATRMAALEGRGANGAVHVLDPAGSESAWAQPTTLFSGGAGLASTAHDYLRFTRMLLGKGELDGVRILGRRTVEYMTGNHLPTGGDLGTMGLASWDGYSYLGVGFGLGFAVVIDPVRAQTIGSAGEYNWGGAASTLFWVDPAEEIIAMLFAQTMPSINETTRRELMALVYGAVTR